MTEIALQTGLRALLSSRYVLDTIGHNLANANTPGYSRQRVDLSAALPFARRGLLVGGGVDADVVRRSVDDLLASRILTQRGIGGGLRAQLGLMTEIEAAFGEPGENSLGSRLDGFFTSVSELSASPSDSILRTSMVQAAGTLTGQFNDLATSLERVRVDVLAEADARVTEVNELAEQLASLNTRIAETEANGVLANDLRDERGRLLDELSELVEVRTIEEPGGALRVLVSGNTLVGRDRARQMSAETDTDGGLVFRIEGANGYVPVTSGALGGLRDFRGELVTDLATRMDRLAKGLIREVNRVHSTGIPADGPFTALSGSSRLVDVDGDGKLEDELLSKAGLPFAVRSGTLDVNVTDSANGTTRKHRIAISGTHTTVGDFLEAVNDVPHLSADLDSSGRLRIVSDSGYGFDFSRRLDVDPDDAGTFGGARASLGTGTGAPFALADGDTLDLTVDSGAGPTSFQIAFGSADFAEISTASAEEIAAVVNADPGARAAGLRAEAVNGQVFFQTLAEGADVSLSVDGGSAVGALELASQVGVPVGGADQAVGVTVGGVYQGERDEVYSFRPRSDGTIGTTPDLVVDVLDSAGNLVTSLQVGEGYTPGTELEVADGITVSFGLGELSASSNDAFALEAVVDSDTSDVLVALGLNSFFEGTGAQDIRVRDALQRDPSLVSTSLTGAAGDNALLLDLLDVEEQPVADLENASLGRFYGSVVGSLGFEVSVTTDAYTANETLVGSLEQRRDSVSGVNTDEELVDLVRFEQAFSAAAQYISVVNQLGEEVLGLI